MPEETLDQLASKKLLRGWRGFRPSGLLGAASSSCDSLIVPPSVSICVRFPCKPQVGSHLPPLK